MTDWSQRRRSPQIRRVAVVGGGISGLSAAHRLHRLARTDGREIDVRIFESGDRAGGAIRTRREGSFLIEGGPDSVVAMKPAGIALCRELGLGDELIQLGGPGPTMALVHRGRLHTLPSGFFMMAPTQLGPFLRSPLLSWPGKARAACEPFVPRRQDPDADESLRSFVTRRFGRELFERIAEPIVAGLFTADADELSMAMTMPRFLELERRHGSITRGLIKAMAARKTGQPAERARLTGLVAVRGGMGRLVERVLSRLPDGALATGSRIEALRRDASGLSWSLVGATPAGMTFDAVVVACPAYGASAVLSSHDSSLAAALGRMDYASCATVHLAYRRRDLARPLSGFGFFVPRTERLPVLACNYMSEKFDDMAPDDHVLLRAFVGGALRPDALEGGDEAVARRTHQTLAALLSIGGAPAFSRVERFDRAMAQLKVGDGGRMADIGRRVAAHPGLFLCGSSAGALGLPDCIASGERAAEQAWAFLVQQADRLELAM